METFVIFMVSLLFHCLANVAEIFTDTWNIVFSKQI